ncbi:MAG: DUF4157 domain-containing protein [Rhizomicrobium sp.]
MADFAPPARKASAPPAANRAGSGGLSRFDSAPSVRAIQAMAQSLNAAPAVRRVAQLAAAPANRTGLSDGLKSGIEALAGVSLDGVRVHRNSDAPAQLGAHAYAQGGDIHLAPGQDGHLPHEAWHVVQQQQGRVKPTTQLGRVAINDDSALEREADAMGTKALSVPAGAGQTPVQRTSLAVPAVAQRQPITPEAAAAALAARAPAFAAAPHEILTPEGDDDDPNCHGYTIHQDVRHSLFPGELLARIGQIPSVVFVNAGEIAHSGRLNGDGTLTHLLKGVGVLRSTIGASTMGFDRRFTLPAERAALEAYLQPGDEEQIGDRIEEMILAVSRAFRDPAASAEKIAGAEGLRAQLYALQNDLDADDPQVGEQEVNAIVDAFNAFAARYPEILEDDD